MENQLDEEDDSKVSHISFGTAVTDLDFDNTKILKALELSLLAIKKCQQDIMT